jgi:hypothetical protein
LAGLAGLAVLELHCANFEALHVLVWHTLVVPVSAGFGALIGCFLLNSSSFPQRTPTSGCGNH